jgi:protein-tyrosine-phosphatase
VHIKMTQAGRIIFICNRNVVRSYFCEVIFSKLYPHRSFHSAGLISDFEKRDLRWRANLLAAWGIDEPVRAPQSFESLKENILDGDILLFLDSNLKDVFNKFLSDKPRVESYSASNLLPNWTHPFDPYNNNDDDVLLSISRSIFTAHQLLWNELSLPQDNSTAFFWSDTKYFNFSVNEFCASSLAQGDNVLFFNPIKLDRLPIHYFNLGDFQTDGLAPISNDFPIIYMPQFEPHLINRFLFSESWVANYRSWVNMHPMRLVCGPIQDGSRYLPGPLNIGKLANRYELLQ